MNPEMTRYTKWCNVKPVFSLIRPMMVVFSLYLTTRALQSLNWRHFSILNRFLDRLCGMTSLRMSFPPSRYTFLSTRASLFSLSMVSSLRSSFFRLTIFLVMFSLIHFSFFALSVFFHHFFTALALAIAGEIFSLAGFASAAQTILMEFVSIEFLLFFYGFALCTLFHSYPLKRKHPGLLPDCVTKQVAEVIFTLDNSIRTTNLFGDTNILAHSRVYVK